MAVAWLPAMAMPARLGGLLRDTASRPRSAATRYTVERDVPVPMPDGVVLVGGLYRPTTQQGPLPVVLIRTHYGRAGLGGQVFAGPLARCGFQVFLQSTRGTFPRPVVHHLPAGGGLNEQPDPGDGAPSRFTYDCAVPTPTVGGPLLQPPGRQADDGVVEARGDVLVLTGPVLDADSDVVGPVRALVHVRTDQEYADVFVRVCDVAPDGVSRNVVDGIRRLDPRTVPAADVVVGDDGVLAVDVELFPSAYRFRAGHRIRLQVCGGALPQSAPHPSSFGLPVLG